MEVILLCGGLGTRLRSVVNDRPKPLADVCGRPFMQYIIDELLKQYPEGCRVIFAAGYRGKMVEDFFRDGRRFGFEAVYSYEEKPLGTGGALRNALPKLSGDEALVLNADTLFRFDYPLLLKARKDRHAFMAAAAREVSDVSRYGEVKGENGLLTAWNEKTDLAHPGMINAGIYALSREALSDIPPGKSSLENEIIPRWLREGRGIALVPASGYFIDIGIPESYEKFRNDAASGRFRTEPGA